MLTLQSPELYYLANFRSALNWLGAHHRDLMDAAERTFIDRLPTLPLSSQALLVRLVMRKGVHFRLSKLRYAEIGDVEQAAQTLLELGWLESQVPLSAVDIGTLLLKDELFKHLSEHLPAGLSKKTEALAHLQSQSVEPRPLHAWCPHLEDRLLTLAVAPLCERLRLMFFGNLAQDWSEFVLAELGIFRYEPVSLAPESRGFSRRQDVDDYLHLRACREAFEGGADVASVLAQLGEFSTDNAHIADRHQRLLLRLAQHLERSGEWQDALALYQRTQALGSRQRQIRVCEQLGRYEQALALVCQVLEQPGNAAELQLAERAQVRLHRKLGLPAPARAPALSETRMQLSLARDQAPCVELAVAQHLSTEQAPVHYVENTLICSLFGLLCWEAIFAPLPGAFFHPFHSAPADLYRPDFVSRRRALFDSCLSRLQDGRYRDHILTTYHAKQGTQSPYVVWPLLDEARLTLALDCIPPAHLHAWFTRLLQDVRENRAGMPDLIQFFPAQASYRMIEVKGPGDRLQDNQKRWLAFCAEHDMPVVVCYVEWQG